ESRGNRRHHRNRARNREIAPALRTRTHPPSTQRMNPQPPPPSDEDLAREERELAALYRRLPNAEPDAALDARVLADADRAVARPARRRAQPWLIGLGSAAALVLVAGIAWRMQPTLQE